MPPPTHLPRRSTSPLCSPPVSTALGDFSATLPPRPHAATFERGKGRPPSLRPPLPRLTRQPHLAEGPRAGAARPTPRSSPCAQEHGGRSPWASLTLRWFLRAPPGLSARCPSNATASKRRRRDAGLPTRPFPAAAGLGARSQERLRELGQNARGTRRPASRSQRAECTCKGYRVAPGRPNARL